MSSMRSHVSLGRFFDILYSSSMTHLASVYSDELIEKFLLDFTDINSLFSNGEDSFTGPQFCTIFFTVHILAPEDSWTGESWLIDLVMLLGPKYPAESPSELL